MCTILFFGKNFQEPVGASPVAIFEYVPLFLGVSNEQYMNNIMNLGVQIYKQIFIPVKQNPVYTLICPSFVVYITYDAKFVTRSELTVSKIQATLRKQTVYELTVKQHTNNSQQARIFTVQYASFIIMSSYRLLWVKCEAFFVRVYASYSIIISRHPTRKHTRISNQELYQINQILTSSSYLLNFDPQIRPLPYVVNS
eukprot:TRINITY_DN2718_c0_g1_i5.p2 TRINITY_DN2718_c0_g1~~TRINITY_DN2718_c0_g1_i5.p2  ORF type:complete len:198 (-),score=-14.99 TRINITY_DN2718_c0_g1_i5:1099-1692(-)